MNLWLVLRALRSHELALKKAINLHNVAVESKNQRPFRPVDPELKLWIMSQAQLYEIESELSETALLMLKLKNKLRV